MKVKVYLAGMAVAASLLTILGSGCGSSSAYKNPDVEATKQRTQGTAGRVVPVGARGRAKCAQSGQSVDL